MDQSKTCPKCGQAKSLDEYNFSRRAKNRRQTYCRECLKLMKRQYYAANREAINARAKRARENKPLYPADPSLRKTCFRCGEEKSHADFYPNRDNTDGRASACRDCTLAYSKAWRERNQEKRRSQQRWALYGLSEAAYDSMLANQGGACAICRVIPPGRGVLHVDHCHVSGTVRGLLCRSCNQGLGHFEDEIERLHRAAEYLSTAREIEG